MSNDDRKPHGNGQRTARVVPAGFPFSSITFLISGNVMLGYASMLAADRVTPSCFTLNLQWWDVTPATTVMRACNTGHRCVL